MAKNFVISKKIDKNSNVLKIYLEGEFDGTSAWELINILSESESFSKIIVNTEKLTKIQTFGAQILLNQAYSVKNRNLVIFEGQEKLTLLK